MEKCHVYHLKKLVCFFCLTGLFFCATGCVASEQYQRVVQVSKPMTGGMLFKTATHNGSITATGGPEGTCDISAVITGVGATAEDARNVAESIDIRLDDAGDRLVVRVDNPVFMDHRYFRIDYDISLPETAGLEFSTHNGRIQVEDISGPVRVSTHNGGVNCSGVGGQVYARTHNGEVRVLCEDIGPSVMNADIQTHNGGIELKVPETVSAELDLSTHNGAIDVQKPVTVSGRIDKNYLHGTLGTGEGRLMLKTHNGRIILR